MAVNAFIKFEGAEGESRQEGFKNEIEVQGWDWEVEAESSWTKGGGASVGKANPGKANFEFYFCKASPKIMVFICTGQAFKSVKLSMCKTTGGAIPERYFTMDMEMAYITKVSQNGSEDGNVVQKVEMVFKKVTIDYKKQGDDNKLEAGVKFVWDIPAGKAT